MQLGDNSICGPHQRVGVVLDIVTPEGVGDISVYVHKITGKQAHHVDHVYSLIEENSSTGDLPLGPPVLIKADHLRLPVHTAEIDYSTEFPTLNDLQRVAH